MSALVDQGKLYEASLDITQLKKIMPEGDKRLTSIESALKAKGAAEALIEDSKRYKELLASRVPVTKTRETVTKPREWECLVTEIETKKSKKSLGKVAPEQASKWRLKVVENLSEAPTDWTQPNFDDSAWTETALPISWRMYHTALLRTKFTVKDKSDYDALRLRGWFFRQQGMEIYLNGELIGKVNNLRKKTGNVESDFNESVMKKLKNGENTLTVTSRHNWRWGMLSMTVYNDGYGFRLDARKVEKK